MATAIDNSLPTESKHFLMNDSENSSPDDRFLFHIFHEMFLLGKIPRFLYEFKYLIVIIQTIIASFWLTSPHIWYLEYPAVDILASFIDLRIHKYDDAWFYYIAGIIVFLILLFWTFYIYICHQKRKSLTQYDINISIFLLYVLSPIICQFLVSFTARCFLDLIDIGNPGSVIFFILHLIIFVTLFIFLNIASDFRMISPVLFNSVFVEWMPIVHRGLLFIEYLCTIGPIFSRLPEWLQFIYIFFIGLLYFHLFLLIQTRPFMHSYINVIASILSFYFFLQEVSFSFRVLLLDNFPMLYVIIIPICITIILTPFYIYWENKRKHDILTFLNEANNIFNAGNKDSYFNSRNLGNLFNIFPYIQLGIEYNSSSIIDQSFLRYLIYTYKTKAILFSVTRILSVFPTETELIKILLSTLNMMKNFTLNENFFIYQMKKIIMVRNNDSSPEIRLLRKSSIQEIESIRGLWLEIVNSKGAVNDSMFRTVYQSSNKVQLQFLEALKTYSNNYELCDEYSRYLIEGMSDFSDSIEWERKKRMIEEGSLVYIDPAFSSFVNIYKHYLTKKIMDVKGNFIDPNQPQIASLTTAPLLMSNNADYLEENASLIESTISQGTLRLSIQNAFRNTHFKQSLTLQYAIIFQTVFSILLYLLCAILLPKTNNGSIEILNFLQLASSTSLQLLLTSYYQCVQMSIDNFRFDPFIFDEILNNSIVDTAKIISIYDNIGATINSTENSSVLFAELMKSLSNYSKNSELSSFFSNVSYKMSYFNGYAINTNISNLTFRQVFQTILSLSNIVTSSFFFDYEEMIDYRLSLSYNCISLSHGLENFKQLILGKWIEFAAECKNMNKVIGIILPLLLFIGFIPVQIYCVYNLYKETKFVMKRLTKIKPEVVTKSLLPIQMSKMQQSLSNHSYLPISHGSHIFVSLFLLCTLSVLFPCVVLCYIPYLNYEKLAYLNDCFVWHYISGTRLSTAIVASSIAFMSLIEDLDHELLSSAYNYSIDAFDERHNILFIGDDYIPTIIGNDKELNEFQLIDRCDQSENSTTLSRYFKCLSIDRAINFLSFTLQKMINQLEDNGDSEPFNFIQHGRADIILVLELNLIDTISAYQSLLIHFIHKIIDDMDNTMIITFTVSICVSLLVFIGGIFFLLHYLDTSFKGLKQMIRLLPPDYIVNSQELLCLILDDETLMKNTFINQSQAILSAASDGIASINSSGLIESFNKSFEKMTGYFQEQLIGQPFQSLFSNTPDLDIQSDHQSAVKKLNDSFELMLNGVNELYDTFPMHCQLVNKRKLIIQTYIIGLDDNQSVAKNATDYIKHTPCSSFLIVFVDRSDHSVLKKQCDEIKEKAQNLIKQIVPPEVYRKIQTSQESVLFTANQAAIVLIQVTGISELLHSRLPQSVLSLVSAFFDRFDLISKKYPAVHSIESSELVYIACCGLFDFQDQPKEQTKQAILFCIDALNQLADLNQEFNTSLDLQIIIDYGGPVTGTVLDNQTPQFTVYGHILFEALTYFPVLQLGIVQVMPEVQSILSDDNQFELKPIQASNKFQTINLYQVSLKPT